MAPYYFVTASRTPDGIKFSPAHELFEDALEDADLLLGGGAISAWILDRDGTLLLTAEQVKLRLKSRNRHAAEPRADERPGV